MANAKSPAETKIPATRAALRERSLEDRKVVVPIIRPRVENGEPEIADCAENQRHTGELKRGEHTCNQRQGHGPDGTYPFGNRPRGKAFGLPGGGSKAYH